MITIDGPRNHISQIWGQNVIKKDHVYRIMKYTFFLSFSNSDILYNVVTGHLVILEGKESEVIKRLPSVYASEMDSLIADHFLVPIEYDEHQQVNKIRQVLHLYKKTHSHYYINHYTILPTTGCNARCYYCFEQGVRPVSMDEFTAREVSKYIIKNCGPDKKISITWFGGEPTIAAKRITQICKELNNNGIEYYSQMITNGYLFDHHMALQSKLLWNLTSVQISMDGTEKNYNKIKSYVNAIDNPYKRVMDNIGLLLHQKVYVNLRMNFDVNNYKDFDFLLNEVLKRYGTNEYLNVRAHPINGEYQFEDGKIHHGSNEWFEEKIVELNNKAANVGLFLKKGELPVTKFQPCMASSDTSVTITPEGYLVNCPEHVGEDFYYGSIYNGITNSQVLDSWKVIGDYDKCANCFLYPYCLRVVRCSAGDSCNYRLLYINQLSNAIEEKYDKFKMII